MCFSLGLKSKKRKEHVRMEKFNQQEESQGLLLMEIEKWKKQQQDIMNRGEGEASKQPFAPPANPKR
ncbi:hypothetical protein BVC80_1815g44 [Macleaya cordata]|uniref:Uncharacterized protein n=1 Tax=Macleaya cordata TaxID=56857 RepID=A0A200QVZ6_MACCD|nr:hypothetical protein BVC80_1815g44 [Macleaya cordata]